MIFKNMIFLDLRHIGSKFAIMGISEISNIAFLAYSSDLSDDDLALLKSKCKKVFCFLPLSPNIDIMNYLLYFR